MPIQVRSSPIAISASRTWYSTSLFIAIVGAVVLFRPPFAFRPDGTLYDFGCGPGKSVFSFGVVTSLAAVVSGFAFAMRDLVFPAPCHRPGPGLYA